MHAGVKRVRNRPKHTSKKVYLPLHPTYIPFTRKNSHTQIYTRACASTCIYACTYTLTTTLTLTFKILCSSQPHSPSSQSPPTTYTYAHVTCTGRLRHDCIRTTLEVSGCAGDDEVGVSSQVENSAVNSERYASISCTNMAFKSHDYASRVRAHI